MSVDVVLALGSNLGDREAAIGTAVAALRTSPGLAVSAVSPAVATAPVGGPEQPDYLNAIVLASTMLSPTEVLAVCQQIEAGQGRERTVRWGPRTLDVDLIAYGEPGSSGEVVQDDPALTLPHPRAHLRAFVLGPWAVVDPGARLRLPDGTVTSVLQQLAVAEAADLGRPARAPLVTADVQLEDAPS
jgi:2-amino-4-hydroxy-6-hydroxymethyldihydropteridine diphosphokinase